MQLKIEHFEIRIHLSIKSDIFTALIKIFIARFRKESSNEFTLSSWKESRRLTALILRLIERLIANEEGSSSDLELFPIRRVQNQIDRIDATSSSYQEEYQPSPSSRVNPTDLRGKRGGSRSAWRYSGNVGIATAAEIRSRGRSWLTRVFPLPSFQRGIGKRWREGEDRG